jgi:16S rRNA (uracil1498-N3)-methyltransferase
MQLFYFHQVQIQSSSLSLEKEETRHITKVLRKKMGDVISITNGRGDLFEGTITSLTSNRCEIQIQFIETRKRFLPELHIAIAPTKMNDRMEWFLEKSTELGVATITPLLCHHSERRNIKLDRFDKIVVSAMKQSLQLFKPAINPLTSFEDFLLSNHENPMIAHCAKSSKNHLSDITKSGDNITVLIGPEGDFSDYEIAQAMSQGYRPIELGNTRLRTETAGIHVASIFNTINRQ